MYKKWKKCTYIQDSDPAHNIERVCSVLQRSQIYLFIYLFPHKNQHLVHNMKWSNTWRGGVTESHRLVKGDSWWFKIVWKNNQNTAHGFDITYNVHARNVCVQSKTNQWLIDCTHTSLSNMRQAYINSSTLYMYY